MMTPFYELSCFYANCGNIKLAKIPELKLNLFAEILVFHKKGVIVKSGGWQSGGSPV
jgi:hypothetical protein